MRFVARRRLLIPYLLPVTTRIEPNAWLIEDALSNQIGRDLLAIKKPVFDHNAEFRVDGFGIDFDFIVAQSIFSHTTSESSCRRCETSRGLPEMA